MNTSSSTVSDAALKKATGKTWSQWLKLLDAMHAKALSHKDIAAALRSDHAVDGWWAQSITVEFERAIGRREIGQDARGRFTTQASRTLLGTMDEALARWQALTHEKREFDGVMLVTKPTTSTTEKWRYWRVNLTDGTKVTVHISAKPPGKTLLAVQHEKLADRAAIDRWKRYWKQLLENV